MSDQRQVLVNAEDLERLVQAATTLSAAAVSLASSASAQRPDIEVGSFVRISEELEPEGLEDRRRIWESQFNRIAEDGPPEVPEQLLEFWALLSPCVNLHCSREGLRCLPCWFLGTCCSGLCGPLPED